MDVVLVPLIQVIVSLLGLYKWALIISIIMSWLTTFGVINMSNRFVYMVADFLFRVTEPALRPIRNLMPNFGGIDLSPIILFMAIFFVQEMLMRLAFKIAG